MSEVQSTHEHPIGTRVVERDYPDSGSGVVTGHAPDGWTYVRWAVTKQTLSHRPCELRAKS